MLFSQSETPGHQQTSGQVAPGRLTHLPLGEDVQCSDDLLQGDVPVGDAAGPC